MQHYYRPAIGSVGKKSGVSSTLLAESTQSAQADEFRVGCRHLPKGRTLRTEVAARSRTQQHAAAIGTVALMVPGDNQTQLGINSPPCKSTGVTAR